MAGPSAAADVRAVSDAMLAHGAEQVLIDGAIDRRAASSPDVADGLIISTGAVLDHDIDEVVLQTRDAVELVRLASVDEDADAGPRLRELAEGGEEHARRRGPRAGRAAAALRADGRLRADRRSCSTRTRARAG